MGFPYHELIPAAILLDHPGITKERFVELLDQTRAFRWDFDKKDPWNPLEDMWEIDQNHEGLPGLASILNLDKSKQFEEVNKSWKDRHGLLVDPPQMLPDATKVGGKWIVRYGVYDHEEHQILSEETVTSLAYKPVKVGALFTTRDDYDPKTGFVKKIIKQTSLSAKEKKMYEPTKKGGRWYDKYGEPCKPPKSGKNHIPQFRVKLRIAPIQEVDVEKSYNSIEEMVKEYPRFHPEFQFDWSQREGYFHCWITREDNWKWCQKDGKYYLDTNYVFDRIPASFCGGLFSTGTKDGNFRDGYGFTDLILTAEAIKHKAWKLMSRRGLVHFEDFLEAFPDALARYERAIWDSHTSLYAKSKGMTVNELLRMRLLGPERDSLGRQRYSYPNTSQEYFE